VADALKTYTGPVFALMRRTAITLDPRTLAGLVFGINSNTARNFSALIDARRDRVAPMKLASHDALKELYEIGKDISSYRSLTTMDKVPRFTVSATVNGAGKNQSIPVDQALTMVAQFRTMMANTNLGKKKDAQGNLVREPIPTFEMIDPDDSKVTLSVVMEFDQMRDLESQVMADPTLTKMLGIWQGLSSSNYGRLADTYQLATGTKLGDYKEYFPLRTISDEKELNRRSINSTVEDISILKSRSGIPKRIIVEPFTAVVERYARGSEDYVQFQPVQAQMQRLYVNQANGYDPNQKNAWKAAGLAGITGGPDLAWRKATDELNAPDKAKNRYEFGFGQFTVGNIMRRASIARFGLNLGIQIKQTLGYASAYGNGYIDDKYLTGEVANYGVLIKDSYALLGRGDKTGGYRGGDTRFDKGEAALRAAAALDGGDSASVLLWRYLGNATPDLNFDTWQSYSANPGTVTRNLLKAEDFLREYQLSGTNRADKAIVISLYNAALAQETDKNPTASPDEQRVNAAKNAVEALYYSNQTFDRTDQSIMRLIDQPLLRMLNMYRGQANKIVNIGNRKMLEYASADPADKPAAGRALAKQLAINGLFASVATTAINAALKAIRYVWSDDEEKNDTTIDDAVWDTVSQIVGNYATPLSAEITQGVVDTIRGKPWADAILSTTPLTTVGNFVYRLAGFIPFLTGGEYKNDKDYATQLNKQTQAFNKALAEMSGFSLEVTRQANIGIDNMRDRPASPSKKPATYSALDVLMGDAPSGAAKTKGSKAATSRKGAF